MTTSSWYVFVEEDTEERKSVENGSFSVHRWRLVESQHVEGGKQQAEVAARELALGRDPDPSFTNGRGAPGSRPGRSVFRMQDGSWLVKVKYRLAETHYRVSIGELIHTEEETEGEWPSKSKRGLKELFGR
ncbi:hypothetical protein ABZ614_06590 [Streptomyces sp. NPDC013178]|uniref:hypothetical protein n=1 Tax=unclassified Streptomyces TaxID=2593676 RepID=UPI0033DFD3B4